ncbi:phosphonate ABC transporter ATP-binding protein [Niveibacterium umoris]|uniref:Phosphonate transport system ATP-binding protein n=1 Tax=Niveibacterium umoris TaxID=1193620 RepID=A0A840BJM4_9RHOO|nr:ATP-binding cassette domain-containing protein [Niveibacterium umoris]MBB4011798.1 phosphonate transport system ATP-binding protein [Niveibacterium umoris]
MDIRISGLRVAYGAHQPGLAGVDLTLASGGQLAIIGPSGAGKTSLLRCLGTALRPGGGVLELNGAHPWQIGRSRLRLLRSRIGMVHQAPPLPPRQRVVTATLAGRLGRWPTWKSLLSLLVPQDIAGARAALQRVDLQDKLFERCDQLSGGQLQRVGIARVLYQAPALVLADEPVSALDPVLADHTLAVLCDDARQRGATLVASLHAVELALARFPRIVGVREGCIAFDKPTAEVTDEDLKALYASERLTPGPSPAPFDGAPRVLATGLPCC